MKTIRIIIILSITANALLAGWWFKSRNNAGGKISGDAGAASASESFSKRRKALASGNSSETEAATISSTDNPTTTAITTWLDIQSADLKEFVRRLRAAGCPDETVKDIILAEVNRRFAARTRELWPERYEQQPFWKVQKGQRYNVEEQKKNEPRTLAQRARTPERKIRPACGTARR
jgi:hypothetical protein